jgi:hypothetical protein
MDRLGGKLNVAEDEDRVYFVALDIEQDFIVLFHNQPVSGLTEDGVLFREIDVCHIKEKTIFTTKDTKKSQNHPFNFSFDKPIAATPLEIQPELFKNPCNLCLFYLHSMISLR